MVDMEADLASTNPVSSKDGTPQLTPSSQTTMTVNDGTLEGFLVLLSQRPTFMGPLLMLFDELWSALEIWGKRSPDGWASSTELSLYLPVSLFSGFPEPLLCNSSYANKSIHSVHPRLSQSSPTIFMLGSFPRFVGIQRRPLEEGYCIQGNDGDPQRPHCHVRPHAAPLPAQHYQKPQLAQQRPIQSV